jgi:hypothetical protein
VPASIRPLCQRVSLSLGWRSLTRQNAGLTRLADHSIYQSDGLCYGFCSSDFALAIVQDDSCWCSNFVPSTSVQVATSQCNKACPGFPSDVCGGDGGLYGYMLLQKQPSGTIGSGQSSSTSTSSSSVCIPSVPVYPNSPFPALFSACALLASAFGGEG